MKICSKLSVRTVRAIIPLTALALGLVMSYSSSASAVTITNGSFESDYSGWDTTGNATIDTSSGGGPVDGSKQALLTSSGSSASDLETFLGISSGSLTDLGNGEPTNGSAIKQTFTADAGDVVAFKYNFLADDYLPYNDFAFSTLSSSSTTLSSISSVGDFGSSGYQPFSITIPTTGTYTLGFGVVNVNDQSANSSLLVDSIGTPVPFEFSPSLGIVILGAWGAMIQIKRIIKTKKPLKVGSM